MGVACFRPLNVTRQVGLALPLGIIKQTNIEGAVINYLRFARKGVGSGRERVNFFTNDVTLS